MTSNIICISKFCTLNFTCTLYIYVLFVTRRGMLARLYLVQRGIYPECLLRVAIFRMYIVTTAKRLQ